MLSAAQGRTRRFVLPAAALAAAAAGLVTGRGAAEPLGFLMYGAGDPPTDLTHLVGYLAAATLIPVFAAWWIARFAARPAGFSSPGRAFMIIWVASLVANLAVAGFVASQPREPGAIDLSSLRSAIDEAEGAAVSNNTKVSPDS